MRAEEGDKKKRFWISDEVSRMLKLIAGSDRIEVAIKAVIDSLMSGSDGIDFTFKRGEPDRLVVVSKDLWEKVTIAKYDLGYRKVDDMLADAVVVYFSKLGLCKDCIIKIASIGSGIEDEDESV